MEVFISCAENAKPNINCLYVWSDLNCDTFVGYARIFRIAKSQPEPTNHPGKWKSHLNFISCYTCSFLWLQTKEVTLTQFISVLITFLMFTLRLSVSLLADPVHQVSNRIDVIAVSREMFVLFSPCFIRFVLIWQCIPIIYAFWLFSSRCVPLSRESERCRWRWRRQSTPIKMHKIRFYSYKIAANQNAEWNVGSEREPQTISFFLKNVHADGLSNEQRNRIKWKTWM